MFSLNKNVLLWPFSLFVGEDDEWLNESNCEMIKKCLMDEWSTDPAVCEFKKIFRKKLFKSGKVAETNYCIDEQGKLFHIKQIQKTEQRREVVVRGRAKEIVKALHQQTATGVCVPGGINTLVRSFTANYFCKNIRKIVKDMLQNCTGTCKLSKVLDTAKPAIVASRSACVMEKIQCDLITITCKRSLLHSCSHDFKYILTVKDCFSKYCWLAPLVSKEGAPLASLLHRIFQEHGAPTYLQSDNG